MGQPTTLRELHQAQMCAWGLCLECGHASLFEPTRLFQRMKVRLDRLDDIARHLKCSRCNSRNCTLVPTTRSLYSFTRKP